MHGNSRDILNASTLAALIWAVLEQPWPPLDLALGLDLMVGLVEVLSLVVGLECGAVRIRMLAVWARCACEYRPPCAVLVPQAPRMCACGRLVGSAPSGPDV